MSPLDELRVYPLKFVAELTNTAYSTLLKDCRAEHVEHVHRGDSRGMTYAQIKAYVESMKMSAVTTEGMSEMDKARAMSLRSASRSSYRRRTA